MPSLRFPSRASYSTLGQQSNGSTLPAPRGWFVDGLSLTRWSRITALGFGEAPQVAAGER